MLTCVTNLARKANVISPLMFTHASLRYGRFVHYAGNLDPSLTICRRDVDHEIRGGYIHLLKWFA